MKEAETWVAETLLWGRQAPHRLPAAEFGEGREQEQSALPRRRRRQALVATKWIGRRGKGISSRRRCRRIHQQQQSLWASSRLSTYVCAPDIFLPTVLWVSVPVSMKISHPCIRP